MINLCWKKVNLYENNFMTTTAIREKLVSYLRIADEKKVKAIYTMVEDDINTAANDWDEKFVKELKQRSNSFTNGTSKTYTWEETKKAITKRLKSKRK